MQINERDPEHHQRKRQKPHGHPHRHRKSISYNSTSIHHIFPKQVWGQHVSVLVAESCPTLYDSLDCSPPAPLSICLSFVERILHKNSGVGCHSILHGGNISQHNKSYEGPAHSKRNSQQWQADSLPTKVWKKKGGPNAFLLSNMGPGILPATIR